LNRFGNPPISGEILDDPNRYFIWKRANFGRKLSITLGLIEQVAVGLRTNVVDYFVFQRSESPSLCAQEKAILFWREGREQHSTIPSLERR
jgi:hypothetical protein